MGGALASVQAVVGGAERANLVGLVAGVCSIWFVVLGVATYQAAVRSAVSRAVSALFGHTELLTRRRAAELIRADRQRFARRLEASVSLLQDIGDGAIDPFDPVARRECSKRAAELRRVLVAGATPALGLALDARIEAAEARGVAVRLQVSGDLDNLPPSLRVSLAEAIDDATTRIQDGGSIMLTLLSSPGGGAAYVAYPVPPGTTALPDIAGDSYPYSGVLQAVGEVDNGIAHLSFAWTST